MSFCTSRRRHARIACASGLLAVATACASPSGSGPELTVNVPVTTVAPEQSGDGVVQIAAFLPATGPGARIGTPMSDAVRLAVSDINAAGGVLGNPLEVNFVDEATSNDLGNALQSDVDAIVGPASSLNALSMLGDAVESGVLSLLTNCNLTAARPIS